MIAITPNNYYSNIWFYEIPAGSPGVWSGGDFMGILYRKDDEGAGATDWTYSWRICHNNPPSGCDHKKWFHFTNKSGASEEEILDILDKALQTACDTKTKDAGSNLKRWRLSCSGDEFLAKLGTEAPDFLSYAVIDSREEARKHNVEDVWDEKMRGPSGFSEKKPCPPVTCPSCGDVLRKASQYRKLPHVKREVPAVGDPCICGDCGELMMWDKPGKDGNLTVRPISPEELFDLADECGLPRSEPQAFIDLAASIRNNAKRVGKRR